MAVDVISEMAVSPLLLAVALFSVACVSCAVGILATWAHWREYYVRESLEAKRKFMSDQEEIRRAKTIIRVHDGLTMQQVKEL